MCRFAAVGPPATAGASQARASTSGPRPRRGAAWAAAARHHAGGGEGGGATGCTAGLGVLSWVPQTRNGLRGARGVAHIGRRNSDSDVPARPRHQGSSAGHGVGALRAGLGAGQSPNRRISGPKACVACRPWAVFYLLRFTIFIMICGDSSAASAAEPCLQASGARKRRPRSEPEATRTRARRVRARCVTRLSYPFVCFVSPSERLAASFCALFSGHSTDECVSFRMAIRIITFLSGPLCPLRIFGTIPHIFFTLS